MRLTRLERLLPYYLECVREDERQGARYFLSDEGKQFLVPPLSKEWNLEERGVLTIHLDANMGAFAKSIRQQRATAAFFYGYPLYVDWLERSRSGWSGGFAVPVFLQPVEYEQVGSNLSLRLIADWPRINGEFLNRVFASAEERRTFIHDIGLLETEGQPPDGVLAHFGRRLRDLAVVAEIEPIDPMSLPTMPRVADLTTGGLYNRCVVVLGERSKFTAGLEHEIEALKSEHALSQAAGAALRHFFVDGGATVERAVTPGTRDLEIVEVVGLNDEQRAAVRSAFENPLTVVTGPPGTGKSQVVVSALANAYLRGERVLFTSRNNKAVDVVEARINGLSDHPLVVRMGRRSGERDLRSELTRFLNQLLAVSTTEEDRRAHKEALATVRSLGQRREDLWGRLEGVRVARNHVDQLDRELDGARKRLGSRLFDRLVGGADFVPSEDPAMALEIVRSYCSPPQGFLELVGRWFRQTRHAAEVLRRVSGFRDHPDLFGELPATLTGKGDWREWRGPLERLVERAEVMRRLREYRDALSALKGLPSPEVFAEELADLEESLWDWGARLIAAYGRLLPDRLTPATRRAVGEFRSTIERLAEDQIGGKAYAQLRSEQERLFATLCSVLPVWCVTNLSARGTLPFHAGLFDLVIIDEASQCDIPSAVPLLFRAKRALIIGDPNQLRHISSLERHVAQLLESRHGLTAAADQPYTYVNNSLFDLSATCAGESKVITLREHFRSHADIVEFSNHTWYRHTLRVCTDYRRLKRPPSGEPGVRWTHTAGVVHRPTGGGAICPDEAKAVVDELEDLLVRRSFDGSVGVVTPFRAQANRIRDLVNDRLNLAVIEGSDLIVDTAHGFQGDERDVILFSPCIGSDMPRGAKYFLSSTGNLFNVAITRARALLHVIGNGAACASCGVPHIEAFTGHVARLGEIAGAAERPPSRWSDPRVGHWEKPFHDALVKAGLKPMSQYKVHQYWLDLAIVQRDVRVDVEIDGEHFHRDWDGNRCRDDVIRDWRLTALGWKVKRFWVYRIRDEMEECIRELLQTLAELHGGGTRP
jgi:very-short-patch-repair endonuclease